MRLPSLVVVATLALFSLTTAARGQDRDREREDALIRKKKAMAAQEEDEQHRRDAELRKILGHVLEELARKDPAAAGALKKAIAPLFESWGRDDAGARAKKLDVEKLMHEKLMHDKQLQEKLGEKRTHEKLVMEKLARAKEEEALRDKKLVLEKMKLADHLQLARPDHDKKPATKDQGPFPDYTRELVRAIAEHDPEAARALKEILGRIAERAERNQRHQELEKMAHGLIESVSKRDPEGARELQQFFRKFFAHEQDRREPQPERRRPDERPRRSGNVEGDEEAPKKEEVSETI